MEVCGVEFKGDFVGRRFDNSRDFFSFCWSERVDFFPSACDVIR